MAQRLGAEETVCLLLRLGRRCVRKKPRNRTKRRAKQARGTEKQMHAKRRAWGKQDDKAGETVREETVREETGGGCGRAQAEEDLLLCVAFLLLRNISGRCLLRRKRSRLFLRRRESEFRRRTEFKLGGNTRGKSQGTGPPWGHEEGKKE
ncbi:hypothetical protein TGVAND_437360 [Toxoplasma gondii VAND]|uniref:Uncharacterized protein n=1 Tax=Toxoplasma gondii VAND TaxID=933077 RepID=A0A086PV26_TOXGO|nr:hypothetical protein TGVAND_437360 [Toxoplasma gondii VAND]